MTNIRNFSIIAHIDHGKSTLADRLIQECGALSERELTNQVLDSMDIEKERGITIKSQTVRLMYKAKDGYTYQLNLMDTPGHVDFSYEVNRCLAACEGSLLIVDSTQGVEAQTLANVYQAIENNHEIIPVLNKIDLPASDIEGTKQQIENVIGIDATESIATSAKTGEGINDILEAIVTRLPAPSVVDNNILQALLVDSWYDTYLGVITLVRVISGTITPRMRIKMMETGVSYTVEEVGVFTPKRQPQESLSSGEIGYIVANIKSISDCKVGDTITELHKECTSPLPGFKPIIPVVFCGLYPIDTSDYELLKTSLGKLKLNDASFAYEPESSPALGFGFRCGFLGLLHLEIIQERLRREFGVDLMTTSPSVIYKIHLKNGEQRDLHNPSDMPDVTLIDYIEEPWIRATIITPDHYLGGILKLCIDKRGQQVDLSYTGTRAMLIMDLPLSEVVFDFYDRLKSTSQGYASFDYTLHEYRRNDLVKVGILVNGDAIDALSFICHRDHAESRGRHICQRLKDIVPRQLFKIALQAAIGGKVIARETLSALRKDVTAKCYGGDISRKKKLLEKQKKGKKRMRQFGNIDIPHNAFIEVLKQGD